MAVVVHGGGGAPAWLGKRGWAVENQWEVEKLFRWPAWVEEGRRWERGVQGRRQPWRATRRALGSRGKGLGLGSRVSRGEASCDASLWRARAAPWPNWPR